MTVGIIAEQDQSGIIALGHGRVRLSGGYDRSVQIPEVFFKCVGFIGEVAHKDSTGSYGDLQATGFVVSVPSTRVQGIHYSYFVTAKHVAAGFMNKEPFVLVNKVGGGLMHLETIGSFYGHPTDKTADIAVFILGETRGADVMAVAASDFVTAEDIKSRRIGVGDEVFSTGLFTEAPGIARNLPIVRHGNIAMLPEEQIQTEMGFADVYLIEARSIGGMSGSPVHARMTYMTPGKLQDGTLAPMFSIGGSKLLGVVHGHWDAKEKDINSPELIHDRKRGVNYGIAIVVPSMKILETLNRAELVEIREVWDRRLMKRSVPGMDSAKTKQEESEQPVFTKQDFEATLKRVSRKIEPASGNRPS